MNLLTDEMRSWVGRRARYTAAEPVGRASIRYFVRAMEDRDHPWLTEADGTPRPAVAPPTMICETNQFYERAPDAHGYIGHTWELPLPPSRMLRAGNEYTFERDLREDDVVTIHWRLADLQERVSSDGTPTLMVISEIEYRGQGGGLIARNRETMAFQPIENSHG